MATINQIELRVNLRANNNEKSDQFGRLYAELDRNHTLSLRGLAHASMALLSLNRSLRAMSYLRWNCSRFRRDD
jgi:hypothetical protein